MAKKTRPQLSKKDYEARIPALREQLVQLQVALKDAPFKVLLIVAGLEGTGRGDLINSLSSWLDPRGVEAFSFHEATDEERARPFMWRFWRQLPDMGRIGIYAGSWYTETLRAEARSRKALAHRDHELERIRHFEKLLVDNDTLVIKIWIHMDKAAHRARLKALSSDRRTAWKVSEEDWRHHRIYDRLDRTAAHIREKTNQPGATWHVVEGEDERARNLAVADLLLASFDRHRGHLAALARRRKPARPPAPVRSLRPTGRKRLQALRLLHELSAKAYEEKRDKWLGRLNQAVRDAHAAGRAVNFVFEGWDAAGKGGAIRRLTSAIDARNFRVIPVAKPTDEEKNFHYLWRFWRQVPRDGLVAIFDRSWYGRVLVERLEGFCRPDEWRRAFGELNDFEKELTDHGQIVIKFWMHISAEEQLRRFKSREETAYKQHKINDEDWRNRAKWDGYEIAVGDMIALTHTPSAPWHLIPADNKRFARLEILKTACKAIEKALGKKPAKKK